MRSQGNAGFGQNLVCACGCLTVVAAGWGARDSQAPMRRSTKGVQSDRSNGSGAGRKGKGHARCAPGRARVRDARAAFTGLALPPSLLSTSSRASAATGAQGEALATQLGAVAYVECSASSQDNIKQCFDTVIRAARRTLGPPSSRGWRGWLRASKAGAGPGAGEEEPPGQLGRTHSFHTRTADGGDGERRRRASGGPGATQAGDGAKAGSADSQCVVM
mmetsp:Transcript_4954/g.13640  ORF Transcript_4954/g.13640 Transcript_4954/m.13640 type:complete len:219 (+) Transcript_4954:506-1162(+)